MSLYLLAKKAKLRDRGYLMQKILFTCSNKYRKFKKWMCFVCGKINQ